MIAEDSSKRKRLDSWKEIADYLDRDLRTAIRWEQEKGLPVHRPGGKRQAVFAFGDEIDAWFKGQSASSLAPEAEPQEPTPRRFSARRVLVGAAMGLVLVAGLLWWRLASTPPEGQPAPEKSPAKDIRLAWSGGQIEFERREIIPSPLRPYGLVVADFNRDGKLDLATTSYLGPAVSVLLGHGDGSFEPPKSYGNCGQAYGLTGADLDGDGFLDLVLACKDASAIDILWGSGDGQFQQQSRFPAGNDPLSVAVGDFNRDGRLDVVVSSLTSGSLFVFTNQGSRTFSSKEVRVPPGGNLLVTDADGDGKPDVILSSFFGFPGGGLRLLKGRGDGTFDAPQLLLPGRLAWGIVALDLNGDGKTELVIPQTDGVLTVLDGRTKKELGSPLRHGIQGPMVLASADFDGDGKCDLIGAASWKNSMVYFAGKGDGTFEQATPGEFFIGRYPFSMAAGDFNGDGLLDLAITTSHDNAIILLLQKRIPGK